MTKDEALGVALEALEVAVGDDAHDYQKYIDAITAIKQARALDKKADNARELGLDYEPVLKDNSNYRYDPPVAEPVAWKWHQAPVKTSWGHDMVVADLAIDKDNTVSVYCERDQTAKVEAMFNLPAQPAPVQEPVAWRYTDARGHYRYRGYVPGFDAEYQLLKPEALCLATPPAAQRPFVGLTDEEITDIWAESSPYYHEDDFARAIEAKLRSKNNG